MTTPTRQTQPQQQPGNATRDIPMQLRMAQIVPASFNEADGTVDVVWTTGARRRAYDWMTDQVYEEELVVTPEAVDMTRFESGTLQVIDSHDTYSGVSAILGIARSGAIVDGEGRAKLAFSRDPAKAGVVADIQGGIIRAMSFGYSVQKYEITRAQDRTDGVNLPLYRAVRWTPMELTFCAVGADPHAGTRAEENALQTRSATQRGMPCEFVRAASLATTTEDHPTMTEAELQAQRDAQEAANRAAAEAAATAAAARAAEITELCNRHAVPHMAPAAIRDGASLDQVRAQVLEEIARRNAAQGGHVNVRGVQTVTDEMQTRMEGIQEALLHRVDARAALGDNGRRFRGMSLLEIGREHLERSNVNTRGMSRLELATAILQHRSGGMLSTSDFSHLLANVANKRLRQGYQENQPSYMRWARRAPNAPDFKAMSVISLGGAPDLLQTNEHGEFKYGAMTDGKETYSMLTYGRIVSFTRQSLINDDLRAFDRLIGAFGNSAARLENRIVYGILTANANLSDGGALFNSTAVTSAGGHANLAGSGAAISVAALGAGRAAMRRQKGLQSEELNIAPAFLIVPATQESLAYQFTSSNYVPAAPSDINEFRAGGRTALEPVVEALLDSTSTTAWYLAASTGVVDTIEYCFLDGADGPVIESEMGFEVDGISYKCREDFAAKAIDFRGLYKNPGA